MKLPHPELLILYRLKGFLEGISLELDDRRAEIARDYAEELVKLAEELEKDDFESILFPVKPNKTFVVVPDGYKYIAITHFGQITTKAMKDLRSGAEFSEIYIDEGTR